jgi:CheY-like chemotaxis protein
VEEAADGHEALTRIRRAAAADESPLVVLLDYHLPRLTGGQVLDALVADVGETGETGETTAGSRRIRGCILMSFQPEVAAAAAMRHQVPLLAKPFTPEEVLQAVAQAGYDAAQALG